MTAPILEIKNLRKGFKNFSLKNVNITLEKGYIMGFIGPNGAGKSTTIKLIMNLLKKDQGEIRVFGMDHIRNEQEIKNRIGFVFDENHFYEELTAEEMKRIIAPIYAAWNEEAFKKYSKAFNLPLNKKIKELSKGMKMKFSLAVALSHNADLLIMDEPTSGLDPIVRSELLQILSEFIQSDEKAVFFSTHITSDLDKIADYVTMIQEGEIVFSLEKDNLLDNYGLIRGQKEMLDKDTRANFIGVRENKFGFEALVKDRKQAKKTFGENIVIEKPSLEDVMLHYTGREYNV
ncbi:MAG: ABC transporter ATP-binding protein [Clostridia bacterium]